MGIAYKTQQVQGTASASTYATLYSTGATTTAVLSTIAVCNTASTAATYRIGICGSASSPGVGEHLVYGATVVANDTTFLTIGLSLGNNKVVRVSSSANTVDFCGSVAEISP